MTKEQEGQQGTRTDARGRCGVTGCEDGAFSGGLCSLHGLQKYYRDAGSGLEAVPDLHPTVHASKER